ncbi:MAG: DUF4214 domain-containing protein [Gammaproteobacteria bacterium]|nr:DUF4214 domain-containing protein [Gammaproteobacteria bacterium]
MHRCSQYILSLVLASAALLCLPAPTVASNHTDQRPISESEITVMSAYLAFYGRPADPGGLAFWAGRLDEEGGNLDAIIDAFANSAEYDERFGDLGGIELVTNLFQQLFGRDPDPGGLEFYVTSLASGERSLQAIALDILNGAQNEDLDIVSARLDVAVHYIHTLEAQYATDVDIDADALAALIAGTSADNVDTMYANVEDIVTDEIRQVAGSWDASGGQDPYSEDNRMFSLTLAVEQSLAIDLHTGADAYLYLLDEDLEVVAEDDDSGLGTNARLQVNLSAGLYFVVAATFDTGESGDFELEAAPSDDGAVLNLRNMLDGPGFGDYASLGGSVVDAGTGLPISGARIEVFGLINGYTGITLFSDSKGEYFVRIIADRLVANTFNAWAEAEGCQPSAGQFGVVDANNGATINFSLDCGDGDPPPTLSSTMQWQVSDDCSDLSETYFNLFDTDNDLVWPTPPNSYILEDFGVTYSIAISCNTGALICYGAESAEWDWGVGTGFDRSCDACCWNCAEITVSRSLTCPATGGSGILVCENDIFIDRGPADKCECNDLQPIIDPVTGDLTYGDVISCAVGTETEREYK